MLIVISPAKNLDFQSPVKFKSVTQPLMIDQAKSLVQICKKLSPTDFVSKYVNKLGFDDNSSNEELKPD